MGRCCVPRWPVGEQNGFVLGGCGGLNGQGGTDDMSKKKVKQAGNKMVQTETVGMREREAYHEAGHAVAYVLLDIPLLAVSMEEKTRAGFRIENGRKVPVTAIYIEGVSWPAGHMETMNSDVLAGKLRLREAVAAMAGPKAEAQYVGCIDQAAVQGAQDDMQQIVLSCRAALAPGKPVERWKETQMETPILDAVTTEAGHLVEAHWSTIVTVASKLLERGKLTRDEVTQIVNAQGGRATQDPPSG